MEAPSEVFGNEHGDFRDEVESKHVKTQQGFEKSSKESSAPNKECKERSNLPDNCSDDISDKINNGARVELVRDTPQKVMCDEHTDSEEKVKIKDRKTQHSCQKSSKETSGHNNGGKESYFPDNTSDDKTNRGIDDVVVNLVRKTPQDSDRKVESMDIKTQCSQNSNSEMSVEHQRENESSYLPVDCSDESRDASLIELMTETPQEMFHYKHTGFYEEVESKHVKSQHSCQELNIETSDQNKGEVESSNLLDYCSDQSKNVGLVELKRNTPHEVFGCKNRDSDEEAARKHMNTPHSCLKASRETSVQNKRGKESSNLPDNSSYNISDKSNDVAKAELIIKTPQEVIDDEHTDSNDAEESKHMKTHHCSKKLNHETSVENKIEKESSNLLDDRSNEIKDIAVKESLTKTHHEMFGDEHQKKQYTQEDQNLSEKLIIKTSDARIHLSSVNQTEEIASDTSDAIKDNNYITAKAPKEPVYEWIPREFDNEYRCSSGVGLDNELDLRLMELRSRSVSVSSSQETVVQVEISKATPR